MALSRHGVFVGHRGGSPDRSSLLIRATEREPDDRATDSEHRNENHSGNPTAPSLMPPRLLDQLRAPGHGPVWRLVSSVVSHGYETCSMIWTSSSLRYP